MTRFAALFLVLCLLPPSAAAQQARRGEDTATFADPAAASLLRRAREAKLRSERPVRSYTALVQQRMAMDLRTSLKDRNISRQETAARVRWSRDSRNVIKMLAGREQGPAGVEPAMNLDLRLFDPAADRLAFGIGQGRRASSDTTTVDGEDGFWIEHPLGVNAEQHYRYASGDTLTVTLQTGEQVRTIEMRVTPRRDNPHTVRGLLWIDDATGALVQAAFRLANTVDMALGVDEGSTEFIPAADLRPGQVDRTGRIPGFLKPIQFDISLVTVEYSLWDFKYWMQRNARFEGMFRVGPLRVPGAVDVSYEIEDVETDADGRTSQEVQTVQRTADEWTTPGYRRISRTQADSIRIARVDSRRYARSDSIRRARNLPINTARRDSAAVRLARRPIVIVPVDSTELLRSELLPAPVWDDAAGFLTSKDIERMADRLRKIATPFQRLARPHFGWGLGEPGMIRYNRVESLSVGARYSMSTPFALAAATVRLGAADLHPNAELRLTRETPRRTLELRAFHELTTVDDERDALGLANSLASLFLGRDAGEYYRATGASFMWAPPADVRRSWDVTAYIENQHDVARQTHVALPRIWNDSVFRRNIVADEALQTGALLRLHPWWGTDPRKPQLGLEFRLQGEVGDYEHARGSISVRTALPLFARLRLGAEAAAGTSTGDVPVQRRFYLGGAPTLRGYDPSTVSGTSMARGRLELARVAGPAGLALFGDWGWAGDRDDIRSIDQRIAVGAGISLFDGLVRLDLARALKAPKGWALELHLDAIL